MQYHVFLLPSVLKTGCGTLYVDVRTNKTDVSVQPRGSKFNTPCARVSRWGIVIPCRDTGERMYWQSPRWFDMYIKQREGAAVCGNSLSSAAISNSLQSSSQRSTPEIYIQTQVSFDTVCWASSSMQKGFAHEGLGIMWNQVTTQYLSIYLYMYLSISVYI